MTQQKCLLSVNVNKIATLRNARGGNTPNVAQCAEDLIRFGAQGITVHPRPDERHIKHSDVIELSKLLKKINARKKNKIEFNIEGYPNSQYLKLLKMVDVDQATLVPDPPHVLTSNAGWDVIKKEQFLSRIVRLLKKENIRTSIFIDVSQMNENALAALYRIRPDRVELYTEKYAKDFLTGNKRSTTRQYSVVATRIKKMGIGINAGHDLNLKNINYFVKSVPEVIECSIGHALISESLYLGFKKTVTSYLKKMKR